MIWSFTFFIKMSKNGSSLEVCSIVNFILGCRFCSRLCTSLHGSNIKMEENRKLDVSKHQY